MSDFVSFPLQGFLFPLPGHPTTAFLSLPLLLRCSSMASRGCNLLGLESEGVNYAQSASNRNEGNYATILDPVLDSYLQNAPVSWVPDTVSVRPATPLLTDVSACLDYCDSDNTQEVPLITLSCTVSDNNPPSPTTLRKKCGEKDECEGKKRGVEATRRGIADPSPDMLVAVKFLPFKRQSDRSSFPMAARYPQSDDPPLCPPKDR